MEGHGEDALATKLRLVSDRLMRSGGRKRGQERILDVLSKEGDIPQRDLGHLLHIQPGSLSEILAKLENKGFITREQDSADRRIIMVRITEEGKNQTGIEGEDKKMDFFSSLTEEEKKTLADLLDKLIRESDASQKDERL
jgi:DNA-binding MarR family transcriptional regulator